MFEFNVSARMGPPPVTMWEPEELMEAFLPLKKPLQNWLKPVNTVKQLFSVQLPEVQPQVSLGTKTEHLSSRYFKTNFGTISVTIFDAIFRTIFGAMFGTIFGSIFQLIVRIISGVLLILF